jgi:hypothetical protein
VRSHYDVVPQQRNLVDILDSTERARVTATHLEGLIAMMFNPEPDGARSPRGARLMIDRVTTKYS